MKFKCMNLLYHEIISFEKFLFSLTDVALQKTLFISD